VKKRAKQVPRNLGRNAVKRRRRADIAKLKGSPGGWKKTLRRALIALRAPRAAQ